jgi:hypothetical protein
MKIILHRAEGQAHECVRVELQSFDQADRLLRCWARTAPKGGSYDKTDVEVHLSDRLSYRFRLDLTHDHVVSADLRQDAVEHALFYAGLRCPPHMEDTRYEAFLSEYVSPEQRAFYAECLAAF